MSAESSKSSSTTPLSITVATATHVGMRRSNNQDSFVDSDQHAAGHLLVVADGMGAHAAGEIASQTAVNLIPKLYAATYKKAAAGTKDIGHALRLALVQANEEIYRLGQQNPEWYSMGTTASSLLLFQQQAWIAHVGDSRVYRLRNGLFEQITFDHSLVWEIEAANNLLKNKPIKEIVPKNIITRCLGPSDNVQVDLEGPLDLLPGDQFLLCSDGLSGQISDEELAAVLLVLEPDIAVQFLVDLTNLRGAPDNVTVLVAKVESNDSSLVTSNSRTETVRPVFCKSRLKLMFVLGGLLIAAGVFFEFYRSVLGLLVAILVGVVGYLFNDRINGETFSTGSVEKSNISPYRRYKARSTPRVVGHFLAVISALRTICHEEKIVIEWWGVDAAEAESQKHLHDQEFDEALRAVARGIRIAMDQMRENL